MQSTGSWSSPEWRRAIAVALFAAVLAACGGSSGDSDGGTTPGGGSGAPPAPSDPGGSDPQPSTPEPEPEEAPMTQADAVRLAHQASFGPTYDLVATIQQQGASAWLASQMASNRSSYTRGGDGRIHQQTGSVGLCDQPAYTGPNCWRDWFSTTPLVWDFYRNAVGNPDQLRQRVAFALQQIVVVSGYEIEGTYGLREYQNNLLTLAFDNYAQVLRKVALSPVMGDYLNNANNDRAAPNENFGRELLQLFSVGTCALAADGTLQGGRCTPTYDNAIVRNYAYALTGWTYPAGGATAWGCWPQGTNCRYYQGDMVAAPALHDTAERRLLSGVTVPAGSTPAQALDRVISSLMTHPNTAPFISRQLIQHLVSSNPSPAYVRRVADAFVAGRHQGFGRGVRGDLAATVAAILLDAEARSASPASSAGRLREPALLFAGTLRALGGTTDGDALGWWWGETLRQHVFRPPSVFNFYPPDYPVPGSTLVGPEFGIHNANSALERLNYVTYLVYWGGSAVNGSVPGALGTRVDLAPFDTYASDAAALVDRLSLLAVGGRLPAAARSTVITAVEAFSPQTDPNNWVRNRVRQAAFLVYGSPNYQVQR